MFGTHFVFVDGWFVLGDGAFNVEWVYLLVSFEFRCFEVVCHAEVEVFLDFFKSTRRLSTSFLNLLYDTVVNSAINSLVLNVVIRSFFVSFDSEVVTHFLLFSVKVVIVKMLNRTITFCLLTTDSFFQSSHSRVFIRNDGKLRYEVFRSSSGSSHIFGGSGCSPTVTL